MGWELPLALTGLALAGLPVLVHLIRRRNLPRVPLPTLALMNRARVHSRRRMRLVDLLLLLCRVLWVVLLCLAVAGPYVLSHLAWGRGRTTSVAIVVDDSMSMTRIESRSTLLAHAVARAGRILGSLPQGSEAAIVMAGKPARVLVPLTSDLDAARSRLDAIADHSARGTDLATAVSRATHELDGAHNAERALVVLSDFTRQALDAEVRWPEHIPTTVERMGDGSLAPNRTVSQVIAAADPTRPGHASVQVTVRGFDAKDGPLDIELKREGADVLRRRVDMVDGVARAVFDPPLPSRGNPTATVALVHHDALPADDARGVVLRSPNAVRILVVDGDPHPSRFDDEVAFLDQALDVAPREHGTIIHRTVDPDTLDPRSLARTDLLVLANVPAPSPAMAEAITDFVERGGGLLVAPGNRAAPRSYAARLGSVLPARPTAAAAGPSRAGMSAVDASSLLPGRGEGLAEVHVHRRWVLEPSQTGSKVLLRLADGSPALVTGKLGDGRTAVLATAVDDDWSDLPYHPGFVPLVLGLAEGLAPSARLPERPFEAGSTVPVPVGPGVVHLRVVTPSGQKHDYRGPELGEELDFRSTDEPGAYRVLMATHSGSLRDDPRAAFVIAPPLPESDLSPAELPEVPAGRNAPQHATVRAEVRKPLAPWLFLLAGVFALLEAWLRRPRAMASREAHGRPTT